MKHTIFISAVILLVRASGVKQSVGQITNPCKGKTFGWQTDECRHSIFTCGTYSPNNLYLIGVGTSSPEKALHIVTEHRPGSVVCINCGGGVGKEEPNRPGHLSHQGAFGWSMQNIRA